MSFCLIWSGINDGDFFVFQIFVWCARCAAGKLFSIVLSINEINFCARYWDYWGGKLLTRKTGKGGGRNVERYFFARYGAVLYFLSCANYSMRTAIKGQLWLRRSRSGDAAVRRIQI